MRYSAKSIANYFLELAASEGQKLSPMKLQKLVYYACGWYAGYTEQPLITEEVEAWQYGPVIPSLYHEFKKFGAGDITEKASELRGDSLCEVPTPSEPDVRQFLYNIWKSYGQFTGIRLSEMTHYAGSPWERTWREAGGTHGVDIPLKYITEYFKRVINNSNRQAATT